MDSLKKLEKERIMNMAEYRHYCICSNCKSNIFPRYIHYSASYINTNSNLLWCPECLKGKAIIFWEEIK